MYCAVDELTVPDYKLLSDRFKLLAHPERLRILDALRREPECVCHLSALLGKPQPYVSQQLRLLREADLIIDEKDGLNVYYRLVDEEMAGWLDIALGTIEQEENALTRHRKVIGCPCPKCEEAVSVPVSDLI